METRRPTPPDNPAEVGPGSWPDYREESQPPAPDTESVQPESQAPDSGAGARISQANKGERNWTYDQNIDKVCLAIVAHVRGESMKQASHNQGFNRNWLSQWKREHPERPQMLYGQAADELNRARLEADIGAYALGLSSEEVGLETTG